jgi:hypothetical protein
MTKSKQHLNQSIRILEDEAVHAIAMEMSEEDDDCDLITLVTGRDLGDTKNTPPMGIPKIGRRYGSLTVGKGRGSLNGRVTYQCRCECGSVKYLTRKDIFSRARMRVGCLGSSCSYGSDEVKAWHNSEFAIRYQITTLLKTMPKQVENEWGGTAYKTIDFLPVEEGVDNFIDYIQPLIVESQKKWWVSRKNPVLPYAKFNVNITNEPNREVFAEQRRYIIYGGNIFTVDSVSNLFGVPSRKVRKWRREIDSDSRIMELVKNEATK